MYLILIFIPLINAIIGLLLSQFFGSIGLSFLILLFMFIGICFGIIDYYNICFLKNTIIINLGNWINIKNICIDWSFIFDPLSINMILLVYLISFCVHFYSLGYMSEDPHLNRFLSYLSLFTFFMLFLISSNNYLQLFFGWEGVGLSSYLLINFWFTREQANKAAIKAILLNKIGDIGFLLAIALIYYIYKSLDFGVIFVLASTHTLDSVYFLGFNINLYFLISLFLLIAAAGKSAQLGLHTWLPDAMEGPTPVSALIHAATMVTAGIYLILRSSPLIEYNNLILIIMTFLGGLTAFFGAFVAIFQNDLKRIIAYSTCSQLGYMLFACGLSGYSIAFFHLINHAFFKALLFLAAGCIIHSLADEQDIRRMGGLIKILPFCYIIFLIGSLSLMGFPYLSGFYSKDLILELAYGTYTIHGWFVFWLGCLAAFATSFYSLRLLIIVFFYSTNNSKTIVKNIHESNFYYIIPLSFLFILSIFSGYFLKEMMVGLNTDFWQNCFLNIYNHTYIYQAEFLPSYLKIIPIIFSCMGMLFSILFYNYFFIKFKLYFINYILNLKNKNLNFYFNNFYIFIFYFFFIKFKYFYFLFIKNKNIFYIIYIFVFFILNLFIIFLYNLSIFFYNSNYLNNIYYFFNKKMYFDLIYNFFIVKKIFFIGYEITFKTFDKGILEIIGIKGLINLFIIIINYFKNIQNGSLFHYLFIMISFLSLIFFIIIIIYYYYIYFFFNIIFILTFISLILFLIYYKIDI
jgi:NADH-ubiquinone oxidoreductase chain 5